jgi:PAS domain S-box-containing protein
MNKEVLAAPALETLLQAPSLAILAVDKQGCVILWSPSAARMFGWTESEVLGRFVPTVPEEHRQAVYDRIQSGLKGEIISALDVRRLRKDGSPVDVSLWTAPLRDSRGEVIGILALYADITARKQAEEALQESEQRFRSMFSEAAVPTALGLPNGRYLQVNRAYCELLGYSEGELLATTFDAVTHPEDRATTARDSVQRLFAGELKSYQTDKRYLHKLGHVVWGALSVSVVRDTAGAPRYFIAQVQDITERKRAEESLRRAQDELESRIEERTKELVEANAALRKEGAERKQAEEALRKSEAKYRTLVEQIPAITYIAALDEASTTLYVSPQVEPLLGLTLADFQANAHTIWLEHLHPYDRERVMAELQHTYTNYEPFDCEYRMLNRTGGIVWFRDRAVVVRDEAGHPLFLQGVMLDVTERKELERAILDVSSREQARIGQDLHDSLCQRLTGIAFLWKVVAEKVAARALPEASEVAEVGRLITMTINEAHGLAQGLCPVELENNDLGLALKELGSSVERLFAVSCTVRCQRAVRLADKTVALHLYRIAQEAISNAIRHGKATHVWINLVWKKNKHTLRIRDNGVGFPGEQHCRRGTGIRGMRYRAQMIGATLTIERESGGGTKVTCVCSSGKIST